MSIFKREKIYNGSLDDILTPRYKAYLKELKWQKETGQPLSVEVQAFRDNAAKVLNASLSSMKKAEQARTKTFETEIRQACM